VPYGAEGDAALQKEREKAVAGAAPRSVAADRAINKALNRDAYRGDLLQAIENGALALADVKPEALPADLAALSPEEREAEIRRRLARRKTLRGAIMDLSMLREEFVAAERRRRESKGSGGFDQAVADALDKQLAARGGPCGR
jgi:hypothetical protein